MKNFRQANPLAAALTAIDLIPQPAFVASAQSFSRQSICE
jgi:hypothetical protein